MAEQQIETPIVCSVCIANYDGMGVIDACIQSILAQDFAYPYEIIIHDDASSDDSAQHIANRYPSALLIRSGENVGYCISNNRMVERARGKYILLLNNDATLQPDALSTLLQVAQANEQPAILSLRQYDAGNGQFLDMGYLLDLFLNPVPCAETDKQRNSLAMVIGACLWIPKSLWQELGGFPEWMQTLAEDMYLCIAARSRGYAIKVPARSGFHHWVGGSLGGGKVKDGQLISTFKRRSLSERNKTFVMFVSYPLPALILILPIHLAILVLEGLALSLVRLKFQIFTKIYLGALKGLWTYRHILCEHRRQFQHTRRATFAEFFSAFTWFPHKIRLLLRHGFPHVVTK